MEVTLAYTDIYRSAYCAYSYSNNSQYIVKYNVFNVDEMSCPQCPVIFNILMDILNHIVLQ